MDISFNVGLLFHRFGPYHLARASSLNLKAKNLLCLEWSSLDETYGWNRVRDDNLNFETLFTNGEADQLPFIDIFTGLKAKLVKHQIEVLFINGWGFKTSIAALMASQQLGITTICMSESTSWDEQRSRVKEWVKRRLIRQFSTALVGGISHRKYLAQMGMSSERIFWGYDVVDNEYFAREVEKHKKRDELNLREGATQRPFFMASARFVEKKNLFRVVDAYEAYARESIEQNGPPWKLVILGDGVLRGGLESYIRSKGICLNNEEMRAGACGTIELPGFKQYEELPEYYASAKGFIHASTTEQWGLVVNEAMASGLPVLVSERCGCARDLVKNGENGFTFDPYDANQLAALMVKISEITEDQRKQMGKRSQEIIADWGPERFARGAMAAVEKALEVGPKKASLFDRCLMRLLAFR